MRGLGLITLGQLSSRPDPGPGQLRRAPRSRRGGGRGAANVGAERRASLAELLEETVSLFRRLRGRAGEARALGTLSNRRRDLLHELRRGPQTVPQLARAGSLTRQHVQALVNQLAGDGYVELAPNPAHRRSRLVRLTQRGEEMVARMRGREGELLAVLDVAAADDELRRAAAVLRSVREALERRSGG